MLKKGNEKTMIRLLDKGMVRILGISVFKQSRGLKQEIDIKEVYNVWNLLRARYLSADTIRLFKDLTHDRDFTIVLGRLIDQWDKHIQHYESIVKSYQLKSPNRPPYDYKTSLKVNQITDVYVFRRIYNDLVAQMYSLTTGYRTSTTNDGVRKIIREDLEAHIKSFETIYKYGKLKGWMDDPPALKTSKPVVNEQISTGEAFHILDHVTHRYHQLQLTMFFLNYAHDKEFRVILNMGSKGLEKEIEKLQQEALKYEILLPNRPPASVAVPMEPETMSDAFMYQVLLSGIQNAVDLHIRAVIETIRNDSLRDLFYGLFTNELSIHENLLKYGKAKGWVIPIPIYAEPV
jgi:hypothetical protein